jgi:hypothetical protein
MEELELEQLEEPELEELELELEQLEEPELEELEGLGLEEPEL